MIPAAVKSLCDSAVEKDHFSPRLDATALRRAVAGAAHRAGDRLDQIDVGDALAKGRFVDWDCGAPSIEAPLGRENSVGAERES